MSGYKVEWSVYANGPVISEDDGARALTWAQACDEAIRLIQMQANTQNAYWQGVKRRGPEIYLRNPFNGADA